MAGEIEEPFSFNFQADSIHSGSISFGRFENEGLSWERRSAFSSSHNRYVEEVEKCMKPGSVIERKAYFEAHFKKKGFPRPNLAECYSGTDYRVCRNDVSECDDTSREECELENEESSYAESDERSEGSVTSVYLGDFEVTEFKKQEDPGLALSDPQRAPVLNHIAILVDGAVEDVNFEELHQPEKGCENSSIVEELEKDVNDNRNGNAENSEEPSKTFVNICSKTEPADCVDKTIVESGKNTSKLKAVKESKFVKPKASISQVQRGNCAKGSGKQPIQNSNTRQRERTRNTDKEKPPSKTALPTMQSVRRTPKLEDSMKGKSSNESKSDRVSSSKKLGEPQPSAFNSESRGRQMINRNNMISSRANVTKSETRSTVTTFKFKSSERAKKRKEFVMKLEEKMHAKEEEMNKVQARKQEKTETEVKQFRKALNFKAAPMPSFYNLATASRPNGSTIASDMSSRVGKSRGNTGVVRLASPSESGKSEAAIGETKYTMPEAFVTKTEATTVHRSRVFDSRTVAKNEKNVMKQKVGAEKIAERWRERVLLKVLALEVVPERVI